MRRPFLLFALAATVAAAPPAPTTPTATTPTPPATPQRPVTDTYHGEPVVDPYRWLERFADPEVQRWSDAQNRYARAHLDPLPSRAALQRRVTELESVTSPSYVDLESRPGVLFALKRQPPRQHPLLVTLRSADDPASERVLVDPDALDPGKSTAIDFYVPSRDGKRVAVSLSRGGSEEGTVHVYDVATGRETGDVIPRVNGGTAGGSVAFTLDGAGLYYTRYSRGDERPAADRDFFQQLYLHRLGAPASDDRYVLGKELPRIAEITLGTSPDGRHLLVQVANGDGGEFAHYLVGPSGSVAQLTRFADRVGADVRPSLDRFFGPDGALYLPSHAGAPLGKIVRIPLDHPTLAAARTVVPEDDGALAGFVVTRSRVYVSVVRGGPSELRVHDLAGAPQPPVPTPPVSSVTGVVPVGDGDELLFRATSYTMPPAWFRYHPGGKPVPTALLTRGMADFGDVEVVRAEARSKDGTRVPLTILRRRGTRLDHQSPTLLRAYGGFNAVEAPRFSNVSRLWLEAGGVLAVANLRGGGEFGEAWHAAGALLHKQNGFDDFAACERFLVEAGYTTPARLAIEGGSNGGLLMGAALTQHPALADTVVAHVGLYDMLRYEQSPNGAFLATEYGSVKDPALYRALAAYSPYHHITDGTRYPAILMMTGANDPRVDPMHSRKMVARLQAATSSGRPVLLRTSSGAGHGLDNALAEQIEQDTDVFAFLFHQLGMRYPSSAK